MRLSDFDFDLPAERIALRPARPRDSARLMVVSGAEIADRCVRELPALLEPGAVLVFNDTKVIPAQLEGRRGEANIGATLHKREGPREWQAFLRNAKRATDEQDRADYQTMFAREEGAVAAPTAALHFTPRLLDGLEERGVGRETLTLHVGAGTFLPVKADDTSRHVMHAEWGRIGAATADRLNAVRASGGRLIAVGTTSLRLLESAAGDDGIIRPFEGDTAIFITPGYRFKAIDGLVTNFHLPRSTLFMLVSALMGLDVMQSAYAHAIRESYRFYSYGDSSLLLPTT